MNIKYKKKTNLVLAEKVLYGGMLPLAVFSNKKNLWA